MAIQEISILKNYMTCEDEAVRNKYYNLIDSFYHKSEGKILESISEDDNAITLQFTDGNTATANTSVVIPKLPGSQEISFISGLQEALDGKVSTSPGKGLSDQNFSLAEKQKLFSLVNYVKPNSEDIAYINGLQNALDDKVDKELGKGLSTNDFTDGLKERLESFNYNDLQNTLWEIGGNPFNLKVPTTAELEAERLSWSTNNAEGAFGSPLKLTMGGLRLIDGSLNNVGSYSGYWSSSISGDNAMYLYFNSNNSDTNPYYLASGLSLRLIVDGTFTQTQFNNDYLNQTFDINGFTYGFVYNPTTSKVWLDRNLGAAQVATSSTDSNAYGDLFQWGRDADGHEKRNSGTTTVLSTTDDPGHGDFIITSAAPYNWRSPSNTNLWQGVNGANNPASDTKLIGTNGLKASYKDLKDLPNLSTSATTGDYNDLLNKPDLSAFNDLVQANTLNDFPATGDTSKLYIALDTGYTYRWDGNSYIQLTDQTAVWGQISGSILNQSDLQNELKKGTITIDLTEVLSEEFSASQDLIISSMTDLGSPQQEILVNDVAYTFGDLINQFDKITVNVPFKTVINLNVFYE